jgi:hypothetical protein
MGGSYADRRDSDEREWMPRFRESRDSPPGLVPLDDVRDHLLTAGSTLGRIQTRVGPQSWVTSAWRDALPDPEGAPEPLSRRRPSAVEISHMDWVLGWLPLIPDDRYVIRKIVAMRMLINEKTGKPRLSYKNLSENLSSSSQAVMLWHRQGIVTIQRGLDPKNPLWDRFSALRFRRDGA